MNLQPTYNTFFKYTLYNQGSCLVWKGKSFSTYVALSHGGLRKAWHRKSIMWMGGSVIPRAYCNWQIWQKCTIRKCRVDLWCSGRSCTRWLTHEAHCSSLVMPAIIGQLSVRQRKKGAINTVYVSRIHMYTAWAPIARNTEFKFGTSVSLHNYFQIPHIF